MGVIDFLNSDFESCVYMIDIDMGKISNIFSTYTMVDVDT